jgi:RNA polymerase primary sigma factor
MYERQQPRREAGPTSDGARLTPLEERNLVLAAESGDGEALRRLVEAFLPAIYAIARRFRVDLGVERQELVQEGVAGLLVATRRYDPERGTPFWAYASWWVRKAMQELVAELVGPMVLSDRAVRSLARIRAAQGEHLDRHGSEPTSDELSEATGYTRGQLASLQATARPARALEERVRPRNEAAATVGDTIADPGAELAYDRVLDKIELDRLAGRLDERERRVVWAHFGVNQPPRTLDQIGGVLGLTAERARQIEAEALGKLREELAQPAPV